jgi:hypothetical protein
VLGQGALRDRAGIRASSLLYRDQADSGSNVPTGSRGGFAAFRSILRRVPAVLTRARRPADTACGSAPSVRLRSDDIDGRVLAARCCDDTGFAPSSGLTPNWPRAGE